MPFATSAVNDGLKDSAGKVLPLGLVDGVPDIEISKGVVTVDAHRLYNLVELPKVEHRTLELVPEEGR